MLEHGAWNMEHGAWSMEYGFDFSESLKSIFYQRSGLCSINRRRSNLEYGVWNMDLIFPKA